jgi:hypothetical protein
MDANNRRLIRVYSWFIFLGRPLPDRVDSNRIKSERYSGAPALLFLNHEWTLMDANNRRLIRVHSWFTFWACPFVVQFSAER